MPDNTFTDRDLVRIFERHLDPSERQRVIAWFATGVSPNLRTQQAISFIKSEGARIATVALVVAATSETMLERLNRSLEALRHESYDDTLNELNDTIQLLDAEIRRFRDLQRQLPILSPLLQPSVEVMVGIRRFIRAIRDIVHIPRSLFDLESSLEVARVEIASLVDAMDQIRFDPDL